MTKFPDAESFPPCTHQSAVPGFGAFSEWATATLSGRPDTTNLRNMYDGLKRDRFQQYEHLGDAVLEWALLLSLSVRSDLSALDMRSILRRTQRLSKNSSLRDVAEPQLRRFTNNTSGDPAHYANLVEAFLGGVYQELGPNGVIDAMSALFKYNEELGAIDRESVLNNGFQGKAAARCAAEVGALPPHCSTDAAEFLDRTGHIFVNPALFEYAVHPYGDRAGEGNGEEKPSALYKMMASIGRTVMKIAVISRGMEQGMGSDLYLYSARNAKKAVLARIARQNALEELACPPALASKHEYTRRESEMCVDCLAEIVRAVAGAVYIDAGLGQEAFQETAKYCQNVILASRVHPGPDSRQKTGKRTSQRPSRSRTLPGRHSR